MRIKLENIKTSLLRAVLLISNSLEIECSDYDNIYKYSISCVYWILAVLYAEKNGILPNTLHKQIKYTKSAEESSLFQSSLNLQTQLLGINYKLFKNYSTEITIKDEYYLEFLGIFKTIISLKTIDVDFFGYLYEYFQQYTLVDYDRINPKTYQLKLDLVKTDYKFTVIKSNQNKKQGSFFTPPELINKLLQSSLNKTLDKTNSMRDLLALTILDPACGGGNILLSIYNAIYNKALSELNKGISKNDLKRLILTNCIYGLDIDEFACDITRLVLFLATNRTDHFDNIICDNFLTHEFDTNQKFSLVIGNPPYLNIQNINEEDKKNYLANYNFAFRRFDLYVLFLEKTLDYILKDKGTMAFIIPDKFLTQSYAKKARALILDSHSIKEIISFKNPNLFKNIGIFPVIFVAQKTKKENADVKTTEITNKLEKSTTIKQDLFKKLYNTSYRICWKASKQELIENIQSKSFPLSELCYISWGAQAGNAKRFIFNNINLVDQNERNYLKPLIKGANIKRYNISYSGEYLLYLTDGENKLHRPAFNELFASKKILIPEVTSNNGIFAGLDYDKYYTNHSIINCIHKKDLYSLQEEILKSRNIKFLDVNNLNEYKWQEEDNAYTRGCTIYKDSKFDNIDLNYALLLINSKLVNFYFKNFLSGGLNVFPELVRHLPVYNIKVSNYLIEPLEFKTYLDNFDYEKIEDIIHKTLINEDFTNLHYFLSLIAQSLSNLKQNLNNSQFIILDNIVNNFIYTLYGLTDKQIALIEEA